MTFLIILRVKNYQTEVFLSVRSVDAIVQGEKQITGNMVMNGDNSITITLPSNVTMVRNGQSLTGQVTINGGDTFHFEAPLTVNGTWNTGEVKGNLPDYQPIVLTSSNNNLQDIGYLKPNYGSRKLWRIHCSLD